MKKSLTIKNVNPTKFSRKCIFQVIFSIFLLTISQNFQAAVTVNSVTICSGDVAVLNAAGSAGGYIWSTTEVTASINVSPLSTTTYTVTDDSNPANFAVATVTVGPVATATQSAQTICSGTTNNAVIALTSNVGNTSFTWTTTAVSINGANPGSLAAPGNIVQTLTSNPNTAVGTVTYTIIPTSGTCVGSPIVATVLINPKPRVTFSSQVQTICSGNPVSIGLGSAFAGTTLDWTISEANSRNAVAGSALDGVVIGDTLFSDAAPGGGQTIYSVIPFANNCTGNQVDFFVTINQTPQITNSPLSQTICSGKNTTLVDLHSDMPGSTYYTWHSAIGLASLTGYDTVGVFTDPHPAGEEMDTIPVQTIFNTSSSSQTVTYSITVNGCPGPITEYKITVDPAPKLTTFPAIQTVCSGSASNVFNLTSDVASTFKWSSFVRPGSPGGGVSGRAPLFDLTGLSTQIISQTLTTTSTAPDTVVYFVTITSTDPSACVGTGFLWTIVKPLPKVISTPSTADTICSDSTSFIVLTSDIANTSFDWTVAPSFITGASDSPLFPIGINDTIKQTLHNTIFIADSAIYSIRGTADGCTSLPYLDTVIVDPTPDLTTPPTATVCSDSTTLIKLTSHVDGTTYVWDVVQSQFVEGATHSFGGKDTIAQTLTNTADTAGTATYVIRPTANGCPGLTYTVTVTVFPTPKVVVTNSAKTICSDSTLLVTLKSNVAGTTFDWTVAQSQFVTGALPGSNDSIQQILSNTADTAGFAVYTITPVANGCPGVPIIDTIFVNPTPVITSTVTAQTICSDSTTFIPFSSPVAGTSFSWTVDASGLALGATAGGGDKIRQKLTNATNTVQTAIYTVIPTAHNCPGAPFTVTVTVEPIPNVIAVNDTICSGTKTNIVLSSNVANTLFNWTIVNQTDVTVTGALFGSSLTAIKQKITATNITPGTVTYSITSSANGCPGASTTVTVTVNPEPIATATPDALTICSGTAANIVLTSNVAGITTYTWAASQIGLTGILSPGINSPINQVLTASGLVSGKATFTIVPTTDGCVGSPIVSKITVSPVPDVIATVASNTICSGGTTNIALTTNVPGTTYSWTVDQTGGSGVTGGVASSGSNIFQTLTAVGITDGIATYSIVPTIGLCTGTPILVQITVAPLSVATPATIMICSGDKPNILLTSPVPGTTFDWTVTEVNVSGASAQTNKNKINQVLTATTSSLGTATYTVTPSASGCAGLPVIVTVTVNPVPDVTPSSTLDTVCSGFAPNIVLISNVAGAVFDWTKVQTNATGASTVTDTVGPIAQVLTATGIGAGQVVYTITPKINGCKGSPVTSTVTVNPVSTATPSEQTICSGIAPNIVLTSPVLGTTFDWTVVPSNVTGARDTINAAAIDQVLTLIPGFTSGSALYTITPSASGCAGTPINVTITVNTFDDPSFNYSSATYCKSGLDPTPTVTGLAGGTFSAVPAGLNLDASTGTIDLSASAVKVYTVKYVTNGICPDSTTFGITITASPKPKFGYNDPFCQNGINPFPSFILGSSGGVFTESTGGVVFANPFTGEINLAASAVGTYTIVNTIPACAAGTTFVDQTVITITPKDDASFNYTSSTYCKTGINPTPVVTGLAGGTFTATPAGLVFVSTSTGEIDLAASTKKVYVVTYTTAGNCPDSATFGITISNPPKAAFTYSPAAYCKNSGANPTPSFPVLGSSAGVFSESTGGLVFANKFTGVIDLAASTPGTYTITNTIPACSGGQPFVAINTFTITALDDAAFNYASGTFCRSGLDPVANISGLAGGTFSSSSPNLRFISATTGEIDFANILAGAYTITYTTNGTCPSSSTFAITITNDAIPPTVFSYVGGPYCRNAADPGPTFVGASNGVFSSTAGLVFADTITGLVDLSASTPGAYTITNSILGCNGNITTSTNSIVITQQDDESFHYDFSTFCQAGTDPKAIITGAAGGTFSASPAGLVFLSTSTGKIDLSATPVGTYTITYTNLTGSCPGTGTFVANITALPSPKASFSYASPYCQSSTPNAFPIIPAGSFPGIFTSSAGLVFSDPFTGLIDLTASAQGTYMVYNTYDCSGTIIKDSSTVTITMFPSFTVPANPDVCDGDEVVTTSFSNIPSYTWTNTNSSIGLASSGAGNVPAFVGTNTSGFTISGVITVTSTLNGCLGSVSSYTITVKPQVTADAGADANVVSGTSVTLGGNPTGLAGSNFVWNPSAGFVDNTYSNPVVKPAATTVYTVLVSSGGCTATDSVLITVQPQFVPPGGFTPNGDNTNDTWVVDFLDFYPNNSVEIYNRWGEVVFQSKGYQQQWDGMFKGKPLPVGTYYYIINLNDPTFPDAYTGPVTIMR